MHKTTKEMIHALNAKGITNYKIAILIKAKQSNVYQWGLGTEPDMDSLRTIEKINNLKELFEENKNE